MRTPGTAALIATAFICIYPAQVVADMAAPFFFDYEPRMRFDNLNDYPEYVFFLQYRSAPGNPYLSPLNLVRVEDHEIILLGARRVVDISLIAVPRRVVPAGEADRDDFWLVCMEGTHRGQINTEIPFFASDWELGDYYIAPFRISLSDRVGWIRFEQMPKEAVGRNLNRRIRIILILSSPLLAIVGIWLAWWLWRVKSRAKQAKRNVTGQPPLPS